MSLQITAARRMVAEEILKGVIEKKSPATPDSDSCFFCPLYRYADASRRRPGLPGNCRIPTGVPWSIMTDCHVHSHPR